MDVVQVNIKNDDSVQKLIEKTAQKLQNKYSKKRVVNEKILKYRKRWMDVLSKFLSVICVVIVSFSALLFASIVNCFLQGVPSSFAGFVSMKVGSGSMIASGFNVGDNAIAKSVNTKSLRSGDIIAFYNDPTVSSTFVVSGAQEVDTTNMGEPKYQITFAKFFGTQSDAIKKAAKDNRSIIFHEIIGVYEIDNVRWFKTKGSSNSGEDSWNVREDLVVGVYDNSFMAKCISSGLQTFSSSQGVILAIVIPLAIIGVIVLLQFMRDIQILKLQLDVVEEKRKINDPICTKYEVGYKMDNKMKYKVLAQADDKDKNEYISLLWKDGKAPENIRKYCLRKKMYLKPVERLLEVNRICQERLANGEDPSEVAKYYLKEKGALQEEQLVYERKFRKWVKEDKIKWVSDEELEYDDDADELNIDGNNKAEQDEQNAVEVEENNATHTNKTQKENTNLAENKITAVTKGKSNTKSKQKTETSKQKTKDIKKSPKKVLKTETKSNKKNEVKNFKTEGATEKSLGTKGQDALVSTMDKSVIDVQKVEKQVLEKPNVEEIKSTKKTAEKSKVSSLKTFKPKASKSKVAKIEKPNKKVSKQKQDEQKQEKQEVEEQESSRKNKKQETKELKTKSQKVKTKK